jgi:hypothetical protein
LWLLTSPLLAPHRTGEEGRRSAERRCSPHRQVARSLTGEQIRTGGSPPPSSEQIPTGGGIFLFIRWRIQRARLHPAADPPGTTSSSSSGSVRHGYPWVPTDQAHDRPQQVGPAYQKTRRPVSGPYRSSWRPTRPPEDLAEDSPDDLIENDLKIWRTRQDIGGFRLSRSTDMASDVINYLGLLVVTDQESGNRPHLPANIRRARRPLVTYAILKQSTPTTGRRVLLSGCPN